ncbi:TRAP transporter small permease [Corticibacterium sp. UT-5YL-CI-8]|nr:TRAP transporter small permease [Tianweitania sp. UT-5YL-CI-8]
MCRFYKALCAIEVVIAGSFLVLMVLMIFAGGIARSLGYPLNWTIDISTCLFAWACFLSADIAWRKNAMMSIEVVTNKLSSPVQDGLRLLNYGLIAAFLAFLIYYGINLAWISRVRTFQGIPSISYAWVALSLPVGSALLLISTILKIRAQLRGERPVSAAADIL